MASSDLGGLPGGHWWPRVSWMASRGCEWPRGSWMALWVCRWPRRVMGGQLAIGGREWLLGVVVVVRWEIPWFDCCRSGTLLNIPMRPHIWRQHRAMLSQSMSQCHPILLLHLVIISTSIPIPSLPPPLSIEWSGSKVSRRTPSPHPPLYQPHPLLLTLYEQ
jgi:hypothetical protein